MGTIEEEIAAIESEIASTQYNKKTQHHIGKLKAKIAKLRAQQEKQARSGGGGKGYGVKKSGHATVGFVGFSRSKARRGSKGSRAFATAAATSAVALAVAAFGSSAWVHAHCSRMLTN